MNQSGPTRVDESAANQKDGEQRRQPDAARDADAGGGDVEAGGKDAAENRPPDQEFQLIPTGKRNMDRVKEIGNAIIAPYYFYLFYVLLAAVGGWISGAQFTAEEVFMVYTDWMTTEQALGVAAVLSFIFVVLSFVDQDVYGRLKLSADGIEVLDDRRSPFPLPDRTVRFEWKDVRHIGVREGNGQTHVVVQLNENGEALARKHKLQRYNNPNYVLATLHPESKSAIGIRDALPRFAGDRATPDPAQVTGR